MVTTLAGRQEPLLGVVKRRKLTWYGHVSRHVFLSKTILQGTVEGNRRRGRHRKTWLDNIKEWTCLYPATLLRMTKDRIVWSSLTAQVSDMAPL